MSDPLGLSAEQRAAYELLVEKPSATLAELTAAWSGNGSLPKVLAQLEKRSLAQSVPGSPIRYRATTPLVAFEAMLADYEERLEQARRHMSTLDAAYRARPSTDAATTMIEVVTGQRAIAQRLVQIHRGARAQISVLAKPPGFACDEIPVAGRGLALRTIYDRSAIEHLGILSTVEQSMRDGQLARVLPDLPVRLLLADDTIAVLPLQRNSVADAIIVVHPSALLDGLTKLFEGLWQRALPLQPTPSRANDAGQRLITLLLSGLTDEAIGHQLGLSHRTVQRRVATLMADLGAHTRFQAGMQAALGRMRSS
jgi:hypothetical protein